MELYVSETNPKGKNQALTDNFMEQNIRKYPPDMDPKGTNPPIPQPNKKTKIKPHQKSEKWN